MAMELCTIVPTSMLDSIKKERYHMVLAHLVGEDAEYTKFFQSLHHRQNVSVYGPVEEHYKILDNSVIEGNQVSIEELCEKAALIDAQEIILPDVLCNQTATLKASYDAYLYVKKHYPWLNVMAVPQGNNLSEWAFCAREMMNWDVQSIGVPKLLTRMDGQHARLFALQTMISLGNYHPKNVDIHLLGCGETPLELYVISEAERAGLIPLVRSCDSAIAYVYSKAGKYIEDGERPTDVNIAFDDKPCENMELFNLNVKAWHAAVKEQGKVINLFK